ncbi:hypothetical protein ACP70R_007848 [Stipagrostis hirtigluma subsp. patula]
MAGQADISQFPFLMCLLGPITAGYMKNISLTQPTDKNHGILSEIGSWHSIQTCWLDLSQQQLVACTLLHSDISENLPQGDLNILCSPSPNPRRSTLITSHSGSTSTRFSCYVSGEFGTIATTLISRLTKYRDLKPFPLLSVCDERLLLKADDAELEEVDKKPGFLTEFLSRIRYPCHRRPRALGCGCRGMKQV